MPYQHTAQPLTHFPQVLEALAAPSTRSKAMAHQPSIFPEFVRTSVMDELAREGLFSTGICFRRIQDGKVAAGRWFEKSEKALLLQWRFQEILRRRVGGMRVRR